MNRGKIRHYQLNYSQMTTQSEIDVSINCVEIHGIHFFSFSIPLIDFIMNNIF